MACGYIRNSDWKFWNRTDHGKIFECETLDHGKIIDPVKKSLASFGQARGRLGMVGPAYGFCQNLYVTYHCDIPEFQKDR